MNSNTSVSTTRKIGDIYIAVNIASSSYSSDGRTVKLADQAAAIDTFIAGMPGETVGDFPYGGSSPSNQSAAGVAPPAPSDPVDADVTEATATAAV